MNLSVLLIGDGPFATALAENFTRNKFNIIMTTIHEDRVGEIRALGYIPIYIKSLSSEGCTGVYEQCSKIIEDYSLELKYIIHTARCTFYEFNPNDPPNNIRTEMFMINSESPVLLAEHFYNLGPQFIYISSLAAKGFNKDLSKHAIQSNINPIGTRGVKHYSYTKRLGEENLYNFFKSRNDLSKLTLTYISLMLGTAFFKDMGVTVPTDKGWDEKQTAHYIANKVLKGKKRIYPGFLSKLSSFLPSSLIAYFLNLQPLLKSLEK